MNTIGTISRGIKAPIIRKGDDLVKIVVDCILNASKEGKFEFHDKDVVGITEAVLGRCQGNYATIDQIAKDVKEKTGGKTVGLIFPILSRNRFSLLLKAIAKASENLIIQLSYPSDEVGNPLISQDILDEKNIDPYKDVFEEDEIYKTFGEISHPFTGVDYIKLYKETAGKDCKIILSNDPRSILKYTDTVINADIHTRKRTKKILLKNGAKIAISLDDILTKSVDGSGYNEEYGLYGSNLATPDSVKLFPRDCQKFVEEVQKEFIKRTGKNIEVMVYGDGAFKDPIGKIWELADPVVSPGFTKGLQGVPNEIKLKYMADNDIKNLNGKEAEEAIKKIILEKEDNLINNMASQGTTPRRLTDLLGSLCDLTSGSGDKGTPIILIQGYFNNYATK